MARVAGAHRCGAVAVGEEAAAAAGAGGRADAAADAVDLARVLGVAVRLLLDFVRRDAFAAAAAGNPAVALADPDAETAEGGEVARAPFPDAFIFRVGAAQTAAAGLTQPDPCRRACAHDLFERLGADGSWLCSRLDGWVDERGERCSGTGLADTSVTVTEQDRCWGFDRAVLGSQLVNPCIWKS